MIREDKVALQNIGKVVLAGMAVTLLLIAVSIYIG
jgi:hypothetical protein